MTPAALARRLDGIQPEDWSIQAYLFASDHGIQKVDAYEFFPNQPQIVEWDGVRYLNRWTPRDFQPVEGDVTPFLEHLTYLYDGDEASLKFVLDWMACLVQKPEQKQSTALLLTSEAEGIGKGIKGQMLAQLVGVNNTRYLSPDALSSDFNDWLASASLVIVEEFEDNGRRSAMARIKNYITDEIVDINPKHAARYRARNQANFLFFANAAAPLKITEADRRFLVHRSQAQPKPESYYRELMVWFMGDGRCYVLHFLLTRDLSHYNPRGRAPRTRFHQELVVQARDPQIDYLHRAFEAQEPPFACDLVVVKHVVDHVNSVGRVRLTTRNVEDFLRDIGALHLQRQYRLIAGHDGRSHVWAIRQLERWQGEVPVEQVRDAYVHPDDQPALLLDLQEVPRAPLAVQPQRRTPTGS
ncbi:primase-helicase family protein [Vogesella fluminis]